MRLQQIKLSGFKSFVDSTAIEVYGQLVGVVGPNGCGKSNVIDAIRWVLGESSARQLRGESMLDVIFNGSIKRKPVSRATVELIFDNSQKLLQGLWNTYDEISIKRLISRQGESIYYINNQQVRRKDITDLFLGTGVGTKGYAVIEQGMISKIIESKPEDLRQYVEEAAGVSKYRERRRETLLRLGDTAENLQRLEDIHSEIIKQLGTLQEQARVATIYQSLTQELRDSQILVLALKIRDANQTLNDANQFIRHCEDELRVLGYQLEEINQQINIEQEVRTNKELELNSLVEKFNETRTQLARVEERFRHYSDLLKRFENESLNLAQRETDINQEIATLEDELVVLAEQRNEIKFELDELDLSRDDLHITVEEKQEAYNVIAEQVNNRQEIINSLRHELDLLTNTLTHKRQQKQTLSTRQAKLQEEAHELDFDQNYHFIREEIELINDELINDEITLDAKNVKLDELSLVLKKLHHDNNSINQQVATITGKIHALKQLVGNPSNRDVSAEFNHLPEIWQQLDVAVGYELALESVLNHFLHAKVVDKAFNLTHVPTEKLCLWRISNSDYQPNLASLANYVQLKDIKLANIYNLLNQVYLIDAVDNCQNLPTGTIGVTLDGHLATLDYVIYNPTYGEQNILQLKQQLELLEQEHDKLQQQLDTLAEQLREKQNLDVQIRNDISSLEAKRLRMTNKRHELQLEFTKQEQIYLQNQRHQERIQKELLIVVQDLLHLNEDIDDLEIQLEDKQIGYEEVAEANQDIELQKVEAETSLQLVKNRLQELDSRANKLIVDNQLLGQQIQHAHELISDKRLQLQAAKQKLQELTSEREECNNNEQAQEIILLQEKISSLAASMQVVQKELDDQSNKLLTLKNKAGCINSSYQRNLEKINNTKFRQQEQNILLSTYNEQLIKNKVDGETLADLATESSVGLDELNQKINQLESEIAALGLVNLKAIEDLAQSGAKEQELLTQINDLQTAKLTLEQAIEHIDGETRKLLQATFDSLNEAIVVYFRTLFGGGNARLALTDKDILQAGIQIYAEPPGKKNATIHLLSGGEKALAAMSFVFALFSLNPAPFCLLDEVDAPLDDANTQRFCNLVQELSAKTQFVYISHNRLAMEMADQLVGVTMQEKGVSTVVSVSLVDAVKHAEPAIN